MSDNYQHISEQKPFQNAHQDTYPKKSSINTASYTHTSQVPLTQKLLLKGPDVLEHRSEISDIRQPDISQSQDISSAYRYPLISPTSQTGMYIDQLPYNYNQIPVTQIPQKEKKTIHEFLAQQMRGSSQDSLNSQNMTKPGSKGQEYNPLSSSYKNNGVFQIMTNSQEITRNNFVENNSRDDQQNNIQNSSRDKFCESNVMAETSTQKKDRLNQFTESNIVGGMNFSKSLRSKSSKGFKSNQNSLKNSRASSQNSHNSKKSLKNFTKSGQNSVKKIQLDNNPSSRKSSIQKLRTITNGSPDISKLRSDAIYGSKSPKSIIQNLRSNSNSNNKSNSQILQKSINQKALDKANRTYQSQQLSVTESERQRNWNGYYKVHEADLEGQELGDESFQGNWMDDKDHLKLNKLQFMLKYEKLSNQLDSDGFNVKSYLAQDDEINKSQLVQNSRKSDILYQMQSEENQNASISKKINVPESQKIRSDSIEDSGQQIPTEELEKLEKLDQERVYREQQEQENRDMQQKLKQLDEQQFQVQQNLNQLEQRSVLSRYSVRKELVGIQEDEEEEKYDYNGETARIQQSQSPKHQRGQSLHHSRNSTSNLAASYKSSRKQDDELEKIVSKEQKLEDEILRVSQQLEGMSQGEYQKHKRSNSTQSQKLAREQEIKQEILAEKQQMLEELKELESKRIEELKGEIESQVKAEYVNLTEQKDQKIGVLNNQVTGLNSELQDLKTQFQELIKQQEIIRNEQFNNQQNKNNLSNQAIQADTQINVQASQVNSSKQSIRAQQNSQRNVPSTKAKSGKDHRGNLNYKYPFDDKTYEERHQEKLDFMEQSQANMNISMSNLSQSAHNQFRLSRQSQRLNQQSNKKRTNPQTAEPSQYNDMLGDEGKGGLQYHKNQLQANPDIQSQSMKRQTAKKSNLVAEQDIVFDLQDNQGKRSTKKIQNQQNQARSMRLSQNAGDIHQDDIHGQLRFENGSSSQQDLAQMQSQNDITRQTAGQIIGAQHEIEDQFEVNEPAQNTDEQKQIDKEIFENNEQFSKAEPESDKQMLLQQYYLQQTQLKEQYERLLEQQDQILLDEQQGLSQQEQQQQEDEYQSRQSELDHLVPDHIKKKQSIRQQQKMAQQLQQQQQWENIASLNRARAEKNMKKKANRSYMNPVQRVDFDFKNSLRSKNRQAAAANRSNQKTSPLQQRSIITSSTNKKVYNSLLKQNDYQNAELYSDTSPPFLNDQQYQQYQKSYLESRNEMKQKKTQKVNTHRKEQNREYIKHLYEKSLEAAYIKQQRHLIKKQAEEDQQMAYCTFKPNQLEQLASNHNQQQYMAGKNRDMNFQDRQNIWLANKEFKAEQLRLANKDNELKSCTFYPETNNQFQDLHRFQNDLQRDPSQFYEKQMEWLEAVESQKMFHREKYYEALMHPQLYRNEEFWQRLKQQNDQQYVLQMFQEQGLYPRGLDAEAQLVINNEEGNIELDLELLRKHIELTQNSQLNQEHQNQSMEQGRLGYYESPQQSPQNGNRSMQDQRAPMSSKRAKIVINNRQQLTQQSKSRMDKGQLSDNREYFIDKSQNNESGQKIHLSDAKQGKSRSNLYKNDKNSQQEDELSDFLDKEVADAKNLFRNLNIIFEGNQNVNLNLN